MAKAAAFVRYVISENLRLGIANAICRSSFGFIVQRNNHVKLMLRRSISLPSIHPVLGSGKSRGLDRPWIAPGC